MEPLPRRDVLGDDDGLRKEVIGQLHVERKIEADGPASDIGAPARNVGIVLEDGVEFRRGLIAGEDRGVLRQSQIDDEFRPVGRRKELPRHIGQRQKRRDKTGQRQRDGQPAHPHRADKDRAEHAQDHALLLGRRRLRFLEEPDAKQGRKQNGDKPGNDQRDRHDGEDRERIFSRRAPRKADRHEARRRDERARQHRKSQRLIGEGRGLLLAVARGQAGRHDIDGRHRVIDEKAQGDDEGAERNALEVDAERLP